MYSFFYTTWIHSSFLRIHRIDSSICHVFILQFHLFILLFHALLLLFHGFILLFHVLILLFHVFFLLFHVLILLFHVFFLLLHVFILLFHVHITSSIPRIHSSFSRTLYSFFHSTHSFYHSTHSFFYVCHMTKWGNPPSPHVCPFLPRDPVRSSFLTTCLSFLVTWHSEVVLSCHAIWTFIYIYIKHILQGLYYLPRAATRDKVTSTTYCSYFGTRLGKFLAMILCILYTRRLQERSSFHATYLDHLRAIAWLR